MSTFIMSVLGRAVAHQQVLLDEEHLPDGG